MEQKKHRPKMSKELVKEKLRERKKQSKMLLKEKRARLVVKNLPFTATEENLREYFEKYGLIKSVELLKKPDGKLVGCCFIQYEAVQKAAKAKHHTNHKPFLGRNLIVDFAQAKDKFKKAKIKQEQEQKVDIKQENEETDIKPKMDTEQDNILDKSDNSESDNSDVEELMEEEQVEKKPKVISNDVTEGKTVFIKNVPFDATNDDVKNCMSQFGPIYYALVVVDKFTEHSKGTAFVKFRNKEDADKALEAGTELTLLGNILDCHPALNKNDVQQKQNSQKEDKKQPKDSRNLYLVKEGVILAGTKAAEGVSASDMAKRLQLEQYKTQMLRKLNMFLSRERIVVHNLPATWDDKKLRTLVQKFAGKGALIKEAKIMRDMSNVDAKGVGKSKEMGFVTFTQHEHALNALRSLNNNPNIFSAAKRPIVAFSIENKTMVNARVKRLEKSKQKNPKSKDFKPELVKKQPPTKSDAELPQYSGVAATPGKISKMRSRYKLNTQAKLHQETLKKEKRKQKFAKKTLQEKQKDFTKQPRQKINNKKPKEDNFAKLVNDYKSKLSNGGPVMKKSKWYNEG